MDATHDPAARSWLAAANAPDADFPIQNLPFGVCRTEGGTGPMHGAVAIGDAVLDLAALAASGLLARAGVVPQGLAPLAQQAAQSAGGPVLNPLLALGPAAWGALRQGLFALLRDDAPADVQAALRPMLSPQAAVEHAVPVAIGDYSDFFTSLDHCRNTGRLMSIGQPGVDPVMPNFWWMPIAYHGRASSIVVGGTPVRRPMGQRRLPGMTAPEYGPCLRLDYELELGLVVGTGNAQGERIDVAQADGHLFGVCLLNDWSARDIQGWEMAPLGPFLGKSFATSVSPWIVTMAALEPFRCAWRRDAGSPEPLGYLDAPVVRRRGGLDIQVAAELRTAGGAGPLRLSRTSFRHQYWTPAQMVAHHTVGGCNLNPGDLLGTGTISGPGDGEAGTMIEVTLGGTQPVDVPAAHGPAERRAFLEDGDTLTLTAWCEAPGARRIGFGRCAGTILPASGQPQGRAAQGTGPGGTET